MRLWHDTEGCLLIAPLHLKWVLLVPSGKKMPSPGTGHATLVIQGEAFDLSMSLLALKGLDSIRSLVTGETRDVMCKW